MARASGSVRRRAHPDDDTLQGQVLPHLATHRHPKELRAYLVELLGTADDAKALTEQLVTQYFPSHTERAPARSAKPVRVTPSTVAAALAEADTQAAPRELPPTSEMKALDRAFALLSTDSAAALPPAAPEVPRLCLCQGQQHELARWVQQCTACGLLLCAALRPAPVSPQAACPSCKRSPIVGPSQRAQVLGHMLSVRERLAREQQERAAQRQQEMAQAYMAGPAAPAFPTLHHDMTPESKTPAARGHRVLRLDPKTHKVTIPAPKKAAKQGGPQRADAPALRDHGKADTGAAQASKSAVLETRAEDGSALVHDYDDDEFRAHHGPEKTAQRAGRPDGAWSDLAASLPWTPTYIPPAQREPLIAPTVSEVLTEVPELDVLLERKPPGSAASARHGARQKATAQAVARSQGRKGKAPRR